ncbi:MAG: hypothetical protein AUH78_06930 [Gemmatimonadetes bacterium 13_1_40CM_4_69_8]|nr:MAG: hypothetical protein AUH78_06930 [Gemmatimonadetes bacterium 13_1_40CM_4_69_8]
MKDAKITALRIERGGQAVWEKARLQRALAEGRTLDQMNLRQGDEFVVPRGGGGDPYPALRLAGAILSVPIAIFTLTKIF